MIEKFLKAKHWQIFLLMVGIPVLIEIIILIILFMDLDFESANPKPKVMLSFLGIFPIIMILYLSVYFGWLWSIGIGLQSKMPENVKMKIRKFKILFFIPFIYIITISLFIGGGMLGFNIGDNISEPNRILFGLGIGIFVLLHLFSMFCIFYLLYFVSKTIKSVELQREVEFGDYALEFFLMWFYIIGIWIIQPRINKLIERSSTANQELL